MDAFVENSIKAIREKVGDGKVLCALSGGVDSSVAAVMLSKAVGSQLTCVFVDHGLLRKDEGDEVEEVYGQTRQQFHDYLEAEDIGMAVVKFKNGALGTIEGTTNVYPHNLEETLYIFGENGTVKLGGKSTNNIDVWDFADESKEDQRKKGLEEETSNVYGNGHTSLYADVIKAIESGCKPYVDAVAGRNALEMVLAIYKSQKTGQPVKLPLKDFGSTDMQGEF